MRRRSSAACLPARIAAALALGSAAAALALAPVASAHPAGATRPAHAKQGASAARAKKGEGSASAKQGKGSARAKKGTGSTTATEGAGGGEQKLEASITLKLTPPSESLPITDQINLFVPERFRDAGASLPHCSTATLENKGPEACPKGSIVGLGKAIGYTILGGKFVIEHLSVTLLNGPTANLLSWVEGRTPVSIEQIVEGTITKPAGFGEEMSFTIPHGLLEPLPGAPGWLQTLEAHLSGKAGWLRTTSCPEHPWSLKAELDYLSGQGTSIETQLQCT